MEKFNHRANFSRLSVGGVVVVGRTGRVEVGTTGVAVPVSCLLPPPFPLRVCGRSALANPSQIWAVRPVLIPCYRHRKTSANTGVRRSLIVRYRGPFNRRKPAANQRLFGVHCFGRFITVSSLLSAVVHRVVVNIRYVCFVFNIGPVRGVISRRGRRLFPVCYRVF